MGNGLDLAIEISNLKKGKDIKELYKEKYSVEGKKLKLYFTGHEVGDELPLYKLMISNGDVIVLFII